MVVKLMAACLASFHNMRIAGFSKLSGWMVMKLGNSVSKLPSTIYVDRNLMFLLVVYSKVFHEANVMVDASACSLTLI